MKNLLVFTMFGVVALSASSALAQANPNCLIGAYLMDNNQTLDIAPSEGSTLRWTAFNGETGQLHSNQNGSWTSTLGWTGKPDGETALFSECSRGRIAFGKRHGKRIVFDVTETNFESNGTKLVGRLVMPKGRGRVPVVVLIHGSEQESARNGNALQRMFPAEGIGTFVYDKRGTGGSGGEYTQDVNVLADDSVLAMKQARHLAGSRAARIGYQGASQGGWVAPLAANRSPVDFTIVSFGLTVTVLAEDQQSVALDMHFHHHSAEDTIKALDLARSGERVIETFGSEGYDEFDALRQKYRSKDWYKDVHGDFLFLVLPLDKAQIVRELTTKYNWHTSFRYDPMPTLRASNTPQLWILGSDDLKAPSAQTSAGIRSLIAQGKAFTLAVYPGVEHGMTEYELADDGKRVSTRFAPGYFQMMCDFIRNGRISNRYGDAVIKQPMDRGRR
jgi:dienelactone hydrolase